MGGALGREPSGQVIALHCSQMKPAALLAKGASVVINFEINEKEVQLNGMLEVRTIRTIQQLSEKNGGMAWLSLYFEEPEEKVRSKMTPVFQTLFPEEAS